jgi:hypothetical protein
MLEDQTGNFRRTDYHDSFAWLAIAAIREQVGNIYSDSCRPAILEPSQKVFFDFGKDQRSVSICTAKQPLYLLKLLPLSHLYRRHQVLLRATSVRSDVRVGATGRPDAQKRLGLSNLGAFVPPRSRYWSAPMLTRAFARRETITVY